MIEFTHNGDFKNTVSFLQKAKKGLSKDLLKKYGELGIQALSSATPVNTSETAKSWYYEIVQESKNSVRLNFCNSNIQNGCPIAIVLQYGHATKNGGWVEGIDYINPAIQPIFNKLVNDAWKEVVK